MSGKDLFQIFQLCVVVCTCNVPETFFLIRFNFLLLFLRLLTLQENESTRRELISVLSVKCSFCLKEFPFETSSFVS